MNTPLIRNPRGRESGSAVLASLAILAIILVAASVALFQASNRYRTSNQSSRWAEAGQAAEAGADAAMFSSQNSTWTTDGWSAAPGAPPAAAVTKTITLDAGPPAISTTVSVDKVTLGSSDYLRIRSTGIAEMPGPIRGGVGVDTRDNTLRKLSLLKDRTSGLALLTPRATRTVEILAQPLVTSPFQRAVTLAKKFNMSGGGVIDSYNSSDPTKSTSSLYDVAKRQSNGKVGTNDTQGASDIKNTFIYGTLGWSGSSAVQNAGNVTGGTTSGFNATINPTLAPSWPSYILTPTIINGTATLSGGPQSAPARYELSSLNLSGSNFLTLTPHAAGQQSYVEIWVTGNFTTSGSAYITQQAGVHVTYYIGGNVDISGGAFVNNTNIPANNTVNLITPVSGSQSLKVSGSGVFVGTLNAPGADIDLSGSANFSGAVIGKTLNISGGASIHYDEALAGSTSGSAAYKVASWVEGVR